MIELTLKLDRAHASKTGSPIYKQLYEYIRREIENGTLEAGERLPSIRDLAVHLTVGKNTVESAYQQLLAEGYVQSAERSGYRVLPIERLIVEDGRASAAEKLKMADGCASGSEKSRMADGHASAAESPDMNPRIQPSQLPFDFQYGDVDAEHFPVAVWKACFMDAFRSGVEEWCRYGDKQGDIKLREQIASYVFASRGVECAPDQVFVNAGTQLSLGSLCELLPLEREVGMEDPGYTGARAVFARHERTVVPIPLEEDGISLDALRASGVGTVYVTPSHQFPLGMVMPVAERNKLLQWAYERDGLIIEDDYDSELRYQGQPIPALKALDAGDRVVYLGTFSKAFFPATRLSYAVLPEHLASVMRKKLPTYGQPASAILQQAMGKFMMDGHLGRHIRKMRKLYQAKHRTLLRSIGSFLGERVGVIGEKAGMHLLLDVYGRDSEELIRLAAERGVAVYSPVTYWSEPASCRPSYVMLGFGGMNEGQIEEGIRRLGEAWFGGSQA